MANLDNFNANEVEPSSSFEPIPASKYLAMITESEMKPTKNGTGSYLQLTFTVLEGPYKGRLVWARLCLKHPNQQTVQIARGQLSAICRAVGVMQPRDSADLHNLPLLISVKVKKNEQTGELTNEVKGFEAKSAGVPQQSAAGVAGSNQSAGSTPPWRR